MSDNFKTTMKFSAVKFELSLQFLKSMSWRNQKQKGASFTNVLSGSDVCKLSKEQGDRDT